MTLPELAKRADLSKGLLSKLENEPESNPSITTLFRIAEAFGITVADILESERVQIRRIVPDEKPEWLGGLISYLKSRGKEADPAILDAMYVLKSRKADASNDLDHWKFLYQSIEKSFQD